MNAGFAPKLSSEQMRVVSHHDGPILVVAPPGTGKSFVIAERIRRLLTSNPGNFKILALTFSKLAAENLKARLEGLSGRDDRTYIGTFNSFFQYLLVERGRHLGLEGKINILWRYEDRKDLLLRAISDDPLLTGEIETLDDASEREMLLDKWLSTISLIKSHPLSQNDVDDELSQRVFDAYAAGLRASNVYDAEDLPLLAYRLLVEYPKLAHLYRRLYSFVCIDEAHHMTEAQYAFICALSMDGPRNIMLVGDPKQSIHGFNASSPEYMDRFREDFSAKIVQLTENYRLSREVVRAAHSLEPNYKVTTNLPLKGSVTLLEAKDEKHEANLIADELQHLFINGHPDIEGAVEPGRCAILGRNKFALLTVESVLQRRGIPFRKNFLSLHNNMSEVLSDFLLALGALANSKDRLSIAGLAKRWKVKEPELGKDHIGALRSMAIAANNAHASAVIAAIEAISDNAEDIDIMPAFQILEQFADSLQEASRLAAYEDVVVLKEEWRQYLTSVRSPTLIGFLARRLTTHSAKSDREGVALLTVHSAQGLEFDVVFILGMAEGIFPNFRAKSDKEIAYEKRIAFVAVTRSRRLLYFTYPKSRIMPWGGRRPQYKSRFLDEVENMS